MAWSDVLADLDTVVFNRFGGTATYAPNGWIPDGTTSLPITLTAIVDLSNEVYPFEGGGFATERQTVIHFRRSELSGPRRGDTITLGGVCYTVDSVLEDDGDLISVAVTP